MGIFRDFFGNSTAETEMHDELSSSLTGAFCSLLGVAVYYFGGAYVSLTADASTPSFGWADTASMDPGIGTVNSAINGTYESIASISGEGPAAIAVYSPVIATSSVGASELCGDSSSGPEEIIAIIFHKDAMPYSRIERRAEKIFSQFHKGEKAKEQFPTIIAKNQETYDAFLPIYGNSIKSLKENLEIMEAALRNEASN